MNHLKVWGFGMILGVCIIVIGVSFAFWYLNLEQTTPNVVVSDCFQIEFTEGNAISLNDAYPVSDEEGLKGIAYTFTLKNVCESNVTYQINLETLNGNGKRLPDEYIKADLKEGDQSKVTTKLNNSLKVEPSIEGAISAYKLLNGTLNSLEEKEFSLRLWMHSDVGPSSDSMNATFEGKISVSANYAKKDNRGKMMATNLDIENKILPSGAFWDYRSSISKIVIEPALSVKENASYSFDVSEAQDGSVMSYLVANDDKMEGVNQTLYTLYLQSNEGIILNEQSGGLFLGFQYLPQIEGIEYLDTSQVIDMSFMFEECIRLENLDLSYFNTSNVTNMKGMFLGGSALSTLDVSSFDTRNVVNMEMMFGECSNLSVLDVSSFNTSNVVSMSRMFSGCLNLSALDVSSFDTHNVVNMSSMFSGCLNLSTLDVSNFDTSNAVNMNSMFFQCSNLSTLDVSNFDTRNVVNMQWMFYKCNGLQNLDLRNFIFGNELKKDYIFKNMFDSIVITVGNEATKNWILNLSNDDRPTSWTENNITVVT